MISVQSLLPRSSGNKYFGVLLLSMLLLLGCAPKKTVVKRPPQRTTTGPTRPAPKVVEKDKETKQAELDSLKNAIENLQDEPVDDGTYKVALCLPIGASRLTMSDTAGDQKERLLRYYAGMKIGMQDWNLPDDVEVLIYDTEDRSINWKEEVTRPGVVDVLFGGRSKEEVAYLSDIAREEEVYYLSPWSLKGPSVKPHPYYLQMKPGFHAHIMTILSDIEAAGRIQDVVLLGTDRERGRIDEINRWYHEWTESQDLLESFVVQDIEEMNDLELEEWAEDEERQFVFVMPMSKRLHEVQAFIRVLEANELHDRSIIYGLTDWNAPFLISQLQSLDIRLANWQVSDGYRTDQAFTERYYSRMKALPDEWAYEGYMHADLLGDFIRQHRAEVSPDQMTLQTPDRSIRFRDHDAIAKPMRETGPLRSYYENSAVQLLEVEDFLYQPWKP